MNGRMHEWLAVRIDELRPASACTRILIPFVRVGTRMRTYLAFQAAWWCIVCDAHGSLAGASMKHIGKSLIKFLSGITFDNCHARVL